MEIMDIVVNGTIDTFKNKTFLNLALATIMVFGAFSIFFV